MPSTYKLTYFNLRGRAEVARLIFAATGTAYTDDRVETADWPKLKETTPLGQLPLLTVDNEEKPYSQSLALTRYLARELKVAGTSATEQMQADIVVDTATEFFDKIAAKAGMVKDEDRPAVIAEFFADPGAKLVANIEKACGLYSTGKGFAVGAALTWADLAVFNIANAFLTEGDLLKQSPNIEAIHAQVAANANVAKWLKERPVTKM